jgi:hypothetical protein
LDSEKQLKKQKKEQRVSDFVHSDVPQVAVIHTPEGTVVIEQETGEFAHPEVTDEEAVNPEDIELPEPVPYRASTPESDKANVEQLFKEGKITEDQMNERFAEIDEIAKDPTLSPQEEPEPEVEEGDTTEEPEVTPEPEVPNPVETTEAPVLKLGE